MMVEIRTGVGVRTGGGDTKHKVRVKEMPGDRVLVGGNDNDTGTLGTNTRAKGDIAFMSHANEVH